MALRSQLLQLVDELRLLKEEGVESVYLERETIDQLRNAALRTRATATVEPQEETTPGKPPERNKPPVLITLDNTAELQTEDTRKPIITVDTGMAAKKEASRQGSPIPAPTPFEIPKGTKQEQIDWLREKVLGCPECNKHVKPGRKVVFGVGDVDADIFFCGEAPGADEEIQGEPFVGRAGQLLTKIIQATGLQREDVYIGNIMNWRPEMPTPTGNRPPTDEEMAFCLPYLQAQVEIVKPKVIVALGSTAAKGLLGETGDQPMRDIRGKWFDFAGTPVIVTYHPSYLLRNGTNRTKRIVWEDILQVMERVGMPISEKQKTYFLEKR